MTPPVDETLTERHIAAWNAAIDAAAAVADREWVGENSLIGSRVSRKIADAIRDLRMSQSSTATSHSQGSKA